MHTRLWMAIATGVAVIVFVASAIIGWRQSPSDSTYSARNSERVVPEGQPANRPPAPQRVVLQSVATSTPGPTPTNPASSQRGMVIDPMILPLDFVVVPSSIIAEVEVENIDSAQFNTAAGATPSAPLNQYDPMLDEDLSWVINRVADLRVVNMLKGDPATTVLVTVLPGGSVGSHSLDVVGQTINEMTTGSEGMVFVYGDSYADAAVVTSPLPWLKRAAERVAYLNQNGEHAVFIMPDAIYSYDQYGDASSSELTVPKLTISSLLSQVYSLLTATPTPSQTPTRTPTLTPTPTRTPTPCAGPGC